MEKDEFHSLLIGSCAALQVDALSVNALNFELVSLDDEREIFDVATSHAVLVDKPMQSCDLKLVAPMSREAVPATTPFSAVVIFAEPQAQLRSIQPARYRKLWMRRNRALPSLRQ